MKYNPLLQYYEEQQKTFLLWFNNSLEDQDIENIHQLRVSIKKLRATWSLMQFISQKQWSKKPHRKLYSTIFKPAGRLREAQINHELIQKHPAHYLETYVDFLIQQQEDSTKELVKAMKDFDFKELERLNKQLIKEFEDIPNETILNRSMQYLDKEIQKIYGFMEALPDDYILHKIRINLKILVEVLAIIRSLNSRSGLARYATKIKSINSKIGTWHDSVILTDSLTHFLNDQDYKKNIKLFRNKISKMTQVQNDKQENIQKMLPKYLER